MASLSAGESGVIALLVLVPLVYVIAGFPAVQRGSSRRTICTTVTVRIPLLPEFIESDTATGQFVVERDRYVDG